MTDKAAVDDWVQGVVAKHGRVDILINNAGIVRDSLLVKMKDGELVKQEPTRDPVMSEADNGLSNGVVNTVSLALNPGNANSGTTQFFINLDDNSFLDEQGFTVFATLIEGEDVLDAVFEIAREANPVVNGEMSLPVQDVIMERVTRIAP